MIITRKGARIFGGYRLDAALASRLQKIDAEIGCHLRLPLSTADAADFVSDEYEARMLTPITLHPERMHVTESMQMIDTADFPGQHWTVNGSTENAKVCTFYVPFSGPAELLNAIPSVVEDRIEDVAIVRGEILFDVLDIADDPALVSEARNDMLAYLSAGVAEIGREIADYNAKLIRLIERKCR